MNDSAVHGVQLTKTYAQGEAAILLPWPVAVGMLGLTLAMCTTAALVSINKVTRLDPAMVFKG